LIKGIKKLIISYQRQCQPYGFNQRVDWQPKVFQGKQTLSTVYTDTLTRLRQAIILPL